MDHIFNRKKKWNEKIAPHPVLVRGRPQMLSKSSIFLTSLEVTASDQGHHAADTSAESKPSHCGAGTQCYIVV